VSALTPASSMRKSKAESAWDAMANQKAKEGKLNNNR
jgi:hypothetical protein